MPAVPASGGQSHPADVMIAVDPHKASWTAVAVDAQRRPLGSIRTKVSADGYRRLLRFARTFTHVRWAVEGAKGLGAPLTTRLRSDGIEVLDVPAKLAERLEQLAVAQVVGATRRRLARVQERDLERLVLRGLARRRHFVEFDHRGDANQVADGGTNVFQLLGLQLTLHAGTVTG